MRKILRLGFEAASDKSFTKYQCCPKFPFIDIAIIDFEKGKTKRLCKDTHTHRATKTQNTQTPLEYVLKKSKVSCVSVEPNFLERSCHPLEYKNKIKKNEKKKEIVRDEKKMTLRKILELSNDLPRFSGSPLDIYFNIRRNCTENLLLKKNTMLAFYRFGISNKTRKAIGREQK